MDNLLQESVFLSQSFKNYLKYLNKKQEEIYFITGKVKFKTILSFFKIRENIIKSFQQIILSFIFILIKV